MSIIRGVNRRNPSDNDPKQPPKVSQRTRNPPLVPTQGQFEQMVQQMKSLMKQNTRLKHENLQLKQKLMLAKIELENTKLHNQENIMKLQEQIPEEKILTKKERIRNSQISNRMLKIDSSTNTLLKFESQDFTLASSVQGKENEFRQWPSRQTSKNPSTVSFNEKQQGTAGYDLFNSIQLRKKSTSKPSSYSKKDQILDKYRKFLSNNDEQSDFAFNNSLER